MRVQHTVLKASAILCLITSLMVGCTPAAEKEKPAATAIPAATQVLPASATKAATTPTAAATPTGKPKYGGTFRTRDRLATGFDPHTRTDHTVHQLLSYTHNRLLEFPQGPEYGFEDFTIRPSLAEKWEIPNATTYIFHLHQGVKFHNIPPVNGRELVAEDVKFSIERKNAVGIAMRYQVEMIDSIECPDKYTVILHMKAPFAPTMDYLCGDFGEIIAKEAGKKTADGWGDYTLQDTAIGTGPFILKEYVISSSTTFVKNPNYWREGLPYLDKVHRIMLEDPSTRLAALRAGNIEDMGYLGYLDPPDYGPMKKSNPNLQYSEGPTLGGYTLFYRCDKPPFNDVRVRRAVAMAIDRKLWQDAANMGTGYLNSGPIPPSLGQWVLPIEKMGETKKYFEYHPDDSKKLLAEAGYPQGFKTTLLSTMGYGPVWAEKTELIKDMLHKVGIEVDIQMQEYSAWMATTSKGLNYENMAYGRISAITEPDYHLYSFYHPNGGIDRSHLNDPKLNAMLEKQRVMVDTKQRKALIDEIQLYIADQAIMLYMPVEGRPHPAQPWVKNWAASKTYNMGLQVETVWLDR